MSSESRSTQHLTALADPGVLADWRLALCFETAYVEGMLDLIPRTAEQISAALCLDVGGVRAVLTVLTAWDHLAVDEDGVFSEGPSRLDARERAALAQHGTWVRRWALLLPHRIHDRQASRADEPPATDPATGLALLESATSAYVRPVVDACLGGCSADSPREDVSVLDLGGGHGAYALQFAERGCATTLQDLPGVIAHARADGRLTRAGVDLVADDAFAHLAPGPYDLVLCGTLTNLFPLDQVRELVERIRGVLASEGRLAIVTWLRDRGPVGAAFGVQMLVATRSGDAHGVADYRRVLADSGYRDVRIVEVGAPPLAVILARR